MPHACITVTAGEQGPVEQDAMTNILKVLNLPLTNIAEKLGVKSIPDGESIPPGVWISYGGDGAKAYDYIELIDKMTERMSDGGCKPETKDVPE